jgi:predicted DNA-binding transcriptional regulator YafY
MDKNFSRLLATLGLLPQHPVKLTTLQIQARLQAMGHVVNVRTVQRDLNDLCQHYPDISQQPGKPMKWGWREGARVLLLPQMDLPQALAFDLFRREFAQVMPDEVLAQLKPWLQEAERKLAQMPGAHASQWAQKIAIRHDGPPLLPAKPWPATLSQVSRALFEGLQIQARYRAAQKPQPKLYVLNPLGLVRQGLVSYLVATFEGHHDPRLLALHRLDKVQVLDSAVTVPSDFDLQTYLGHDRLHFGSGQKMPLVLHLTKGAAEHLYDTPLSTDQTIEPLPEQAGWVVVKATVSDSPRLVWWILGFGKRAKVIGPERLVKQVKELRGEDVSFAE